MPHIQPNTKAPSADPAPNPRPAEETPSSEGLFRREALEYRSRGSSLAGHPLRLDPRWLRHSYSVLLWVFLGALGFILLGSINDYASGVAVVMISQAEEAPDRRQPSIVALLPGHYRPLIVPGMELRLNLPGNARGYQQLVIDSVHEGVVGPAEARRQLRPTFADAVPLEGPLVMLTARLPPPRPDAKTAYHEGMQGQVEVRVRSRRLLLALLPGLEGLWGVRG